MNAEGHVLIRRPGQPDGHLWLRWDHSIVHLPRAAHDGSGRSEKYFVTDDGTPVLETWSHPTLWQRRVATQAETSSWAAELANRTSSHT